VIDEVGSAGFAGFVVTPEKCRLDLYWVGAPPPEVDEVVRHDRRVVVHADAPYDHAELSRAAEALAPGSPLGRSSGVEITSVAGTSAHVWSGGPGDSREAMRTVTDISPTIKGMWVCSSGATTGENCGIKVSDVDVMQRATMPRSGATYTVRHTARGYRADGGVASGSGDSGGPLFAPRGAAGNDAHAVGVIHGGVEGARVSCGEHASTECSESVIFVPVAEVQRWIGGELRVADGWRSAEPRTGR
jgi:hypothetical protein